ncbi:MAG TPA: peptidoglycan-binding domain-containing protein, partial [Candidatus Paceibacterota bacterium]
TTSPIVTPVVPGETIPGQGEIKTPTSKFFQITDFAIAGATFLIDTRLKEVNPNAEVTPVPESIKTIIDANTKAGRQDIQTFLNDKLSLNPALIVDGNFGKKAVDAIKAFQKLNNLPITGKVDTTTAPYFIKTTISTTAPIVSPYEDVPSIRYVERMNGHIYRMFLDTKSKDKISNSTIPSIYEALFDKTGQTVVYRYLSSDKSISSYLATLSTAKGEFLPQNISDISTSPDKTKFFYLLENSNGTTGTLGSFADAKRDSVFSSPFTEWLSQWDNNQKIYLTTKPSYTVDGSMFILNPSTKTINKIFGGIAGLTTSVNQDGSGVLYSTSTTEGPKLSIFDIQKNTSTDLKTFGLPEKCVWSSDNINVYCAVPNVITGNQYPDTWYQGLVSFDDFFVKINVVSGGVETIANSKDGIAVDGTHLFLDDKENTLFFTNKKDSTLWGLRLK